MQETDKPLLKKLDIKLAKKMEKKLKEFHSWHTDIGLDNIMAVITQKDHMGYKQAFEVIYTIFEDLQGLIRKVKSEKFYDNRETATGKYFWNEEHQKERKE